VARVPAPPVASGVIATHRTGPVLYVLRHGPAGLRSTWKGDDADRPLSKNGERTVRRVARGLADRGVEPQLILTSPYARSAGTAEIAAKVIGRRDLVVRDARLAPGFTLPALHSILAEHPGAESAMLIGHEPDLSAVIAQLCGGARVVLKKAGFAQVDLSLAPVPAGVLVWLAQPEHLTC